MAQPDNRSSEAPTGTGTDISWMSRYLDAWDSHDAVGVAAFMAEEAVYEDLALGQTHEGRDAIAAFVATSSVFSSDHRFVPVSSQASGDSYALEWEMVGTNDGPGGGLPATNNPFRIRGVSIGRLDGSGLIAMNRDYWNLADYLGQVGLLPQPAAP